MNEKLAESIEALYAAFSNVEKPRDIVGCACCIGEKEIGILLCKPLRELTWQELTSYASSAFLTVGDVPDYLYFLPRILELERTDDGWWVDAEIIGRAIGETKPGEWSAGRREALEAFFHAVIVDECENGWGHGLDAWICAIGRTGIDVLPFLRRVEGDPRSVREVCESNPKALSHGRLGNAFWKRSDPGYEVVLEWLRSPGVVVLAGVEG